MENKYDWVRIDNILSSKVFKEKFLYTVVVYEKYVRKIALSCDTFQINVF